MAFTSLAALSALALALAACGSSKGSSASAIKPTTTVAPGASSTTTTTTAAVTDTTGGTTAPTASRATVSTASTASTGLTTTSSAATSASTAARSPDITNTWVAPGSVDSKSLPVGDGHRSTTAAAPGSVLICRAPNCGAGGASKDGPWIHGTTWDSTAKVAVMGSVSWPDASSTTSVNGTTRTIVTNDLPLHEQTGTFPIAADDPAHAYDQNPNSIAAHPTTLTLPTNPTAASTPGCLSDGPIGILTNGVFVFDALDAPGRDAVAHETQDRCEGHPAPGNQYHYHDISSCLQGAATGASTVVGWAYDGYPIVVERDAAGNLPSNADLDACHGRTGAVLVSGAIVTTYHYSATLEYPYSIGCLHGIRAVTSSAG